MYPPNFKVLLCDDSMLVRKQLREILTEAGVETILEASNGQEALTQINEHQPQLVFLDIVMPVLNGIDTIKEINKTTSQAKVVMVSSTGTQAHLKNALEAGAYDFVQKPWKKEQILSILNKVYQDRGHNHV